MNTPTRNTTASPPALPAQQISHFRASLNEPLPTQASAAQSPRGSRWGKGPQASFRASLNEPLPTQAAAAHSPRGRRRGKGSEGHALQALRRGGTQPARCLGSGGVPDVQRPNPGGAAGAVGGVTARALNSRPIRPG